MNDAPLNLYERLALRAFDIEMTRTVEDGQDPDDLSIPGTVFTRMVPKDVDLAEAYDLLKRMRQALILCERQFRFYGDEHASKLDGATHLSLVERRELEADRDRDLGIARVLGHLIADSPQPQATGWQEISTAPQDGSSIRVLGKTDAGKTYVETAHWWNIRWSIENVTGFRAPTHWAPLERLPEGY